MDGGAPSSMRSASLRGLSSSPHSNTVFSSIISLPSSENSWARMCSSPSSSRASAATGEWHDAFKRPGESALGLHRPEGDLVVDRGQHALGHIVVGPALEPERALARRRQQDLDRDRHADVGQPEPLEPRRREQGRIDLAVLDLQQPGFDIAAQGHDLEVGPHRAQLRRAARRRGTDRRALRAARRSTAPRSAGRGRRRAGASPPSGSRAAARSRRPSSNGRRNRPRG